MYEYYIPVFYMDAITYPCLNPEAGLALVKKAPDEFTWGCKFADIVLMVFDQLNRYTVLAC